MRLNGVTNEAMLAAFALAATLTAALPLRAAAQYLVFRFAPPDGTVLEEVYRVRKELIGLANPETETSESVTRFTIRRTRTGYTVLAEPVRRRTVPIKSPDARAIMLSNFAITYDLDSLGNLVGLRGADDVFRQLDELQLAEFAAMFGQERKSIAEMVTETWNETRVFGFLAGSVLKTDTLYSAEGTTPWMSGPTNPVTISSTTLAPSSPTCTEPGCVQVLTTSRSQDPSIGTQMVQVMRTGFMRAFAMMAEELRKAGETVPVGIDSLIPKFELRDPTLIEEELRTLDPVTGLPYSIVRTRTVDATFFIEGEQPSPFRGRYIYTLVYRRIR